MKNEFVNYEQALATFPDEDEYINSLNKQD